MNPVLISIGGYDLHYYTVFVLIAVFIGFALARREAARFNISKDFMFNLCFWTVIAGLIGARVWFVIFNWTYYSENLGQIIRTWNGGLAIHGGIIFGMITAYLYCKKYKVNVLRYFDIMALPLLFGQAIGRWGNFFNQEAHGAATTAERISNFFTPNFVVQGMHIDGVYYTPTFYYEFLACMILFIVLLFVRRAQYVKIGTITGLYLIGHGIIRFILEMTRTDALMLGGFRVAQIVTVVMFLVGIIIVMINSRKNKFEDLYNDASNIEKSTF